MNKELVRATLTKLLEVPINDSMPNRSGVCLELGIAAVIKSGVDISEMKRRVLIGLAEQTEEYQWCCGNCVVIYKNNRCDCNLGIMTHNRRQFVQTLLGELSND